MPVNQYILSIKDKDYNMFKHSTFTASTPGKHILFLGAIHGNEIAGTHAQQKIIHEITQNRIHLKSGQITFIPIVNEAAQARDSRFVDINLNRVIKYHTHPSNNEEKIANCLLPFLNACDIMLDLHSTHCPHDKPFAFIDYPNDTNKELLSLIPVQTALAGWPQIYQDNPNIENNSTEEYIHLQNKTGLTVECGYHKAPEAAQIAYQSILNVLTYFDIIESTQTIHSHQPHIIYLDSYTIKKATGHFVRDFQHLDQLSAGEQISVYESGQQLIAPTNGYIIMPNPDAQIGAEWFYFGHDK